MRLVTHLRFILPCIVCISTIVLLSRWGKPLAPSGKVAPRNEKAPVESDSGASRFEPIEFDAGYIMDGDFVEHRFVFTNHAPHKLTMKQVRSSCSCSVIKADFPSELGAHSSMEIPVRMQAVGGPGEFSRTVAYIEIQNADPVPLVIKCNLISGFPRSVDFGKLKQGDVAVKDFFIRTLPASSISVTKLEYDVSFFVVTYE